MKEETKNELAKFFLWLHEKDYGVKTFETGTVNFDGRQTYVDDVMEQYLIEESDEQ